jgi:hypothetical protein
MHLGMRLQRLSRRKNGLFGGCAALPKNCKLYRSIEPVGATTTPPPERKGASILRRILTGVTLGVVLLALVGAGGAFAQSVGGVIQCEVRPCIATGDNQVLFERVGDDVPDRMIAKGAHDILRADTYTDDRDVARGGGGHDTLHVDDGDTQDAAIGGLGSNDVCWVDAHIEASDTCEVVRYD